jgi:hypothetical protein
MRNKFTKITLTAGIALAITFTLNACSSDSDDDNGGIHDDGSLSSLPEYQELQEQLKYYNPTNSQATGRRYSSNDYSGFNLAVLPNKRGEFMPYLMYT